MCFRAGTERLKIVMRHYACQRPRQNCILICDTATLAAARSNAKGSTFLQQESNWTKTPARKRLRPPSAREANSGKC